MTRKRLADALERATDRRLRRRHIPRFGLRDLGITPRPVSTYIGQLAAEAEPPSRGGESDGS